ncbi:hypothetical protein COU74_00940 [Candidatus Peregrinibacteria bacterium CG10_big_fil_rev_8_21_14_0_10_36_19]|nr:MAG: hypothetical protein COU74_00940 [Candidatus Peregrinibacteria bacterium CG10_big_fil_rev_8_21_14_0_10_36_19]
MINNIKPILKEGKKIISIVYNNILDVDTIFNGNNFVCILIVNSSIFVPPKIVSWILKSKCKYLYIYGQNAEKIENLIDHEHISQYENFNIPNEDDIITMAIKNESLSEVLFMAFNFASFQDKSLDNILILQIEKTFSFVEIDNAIKNTKVI